jgi:hypothetical protein
MLPGKQSSELIANLPMEPQEVFSLREKQLREAFHLLGMARVWHTDYRSANILYVEALQRWYIIDFDHAVCPVGWQPVPTKFTACSNRAVVCAEQIAAACPTLRSSEAGTIVEVMWDDRLETIMFEQMLFRMYKNAACGGRVDGCSMMISCSSCCFVEEKAECT